jgi:FkbM family methyltransferase
LPDVESVPGHGFARSACLYRGRPAGQAPLAHDRDQGAPVELFSCGIHGECTETRVAEGVECCATCPHFWPRNDSPAASGTPENSVATMVEVLRGPRREWPEDWPYWGTTLEAHRLLAAEFREQMPPYPTGKYRGRGIVILGGGPFFPGVYVTVRMIRHFGCQLPIEVWHHGQREPVIRPWLEALGATCVDLDARVNAATPPPRLHGAWASKVFAIMNSSFEEVLYLDSDCYPLVDVDRLFDLNRHGTIFWHDFPVGEQNIHWHIHPTLPVKIPEVNSGQLLLDKSRSWQALLFAQWWIERADYSFRHGLGDQDILRGVWSCLHQPVTVFASAPAVATSISLICYGPDGTTPYFVHRVTDKLRLSCLPIVTTAAGEIGLYRSGAIAGEPQFQAEFPGESLAFDFLEEFKQRFARDPVRFRPQTVDALIWDEVTVHNVYGLPRKLSSGSVLIDVGAHIGSFTHFALQRGADHVWAFEVDPDNLAKCAENLEIWGNKVTLRAQAVWSSGGRAGFIPSPRDITTTGRVIAGGEVVETVALDDILEEASAGNRPVYMLKLDCEGSEWPILFASKRLALCENIVGEYHCCEWEGKRRGPDDLCRVLEGHGFAVCTLPSSEHLGLFWATRTENDE